MTNWTELVLGIFITIALATCFTVFVLKVSSCVMVTKLKQIDKHEDRLIELSKQGYIEVEGPCIYKIQEKVK